jgi:serine/threonine protein phosphatase PrpC
MSQSKLYSSSVTDRGLNERRPLNEDSFLEDAERRIFAVADGVGGAEAGEVASQTAIEVLDEAFRHQVDGADIEDLMELAIQRANASIHRMSHEHQKLSMMATTVVVLHLRGNIATIGHVGDSRLYRFTPEGNLIRETEDHSIVEEEVRAGRMTPEQAANHPSKNVISRALGAEETVEVDLKTIEVADGSCFLLCSDGITRHISDNELRLLLMGNDDLASVCAELKRRCYERGAEDNLTAVIVRLGEPVSDRSEWEDQRTLSLDERPRPARAIVAEEPVTRLSDPFDTTEDALSSPSRVLIPASGASPEAKQPAAQERTLNISDSRPSEGGAGRAFARFLIFLLFIAVVGAAFYGGTLYKGPLPFGLSRTLEIPPVLPPMPVEADPLLEFERARREVDQAPEAWLANELPIELARQKITNAVDSTDPEFLYLYGRALLLSGKNDEAGNALEQAISHATRYPTATNMTIRKEATLALAVVTLKSKKEIQRALKHFDEIVAKPANSNAR